MFKKTSILSGLLLTANSAYALPIDWHGVFGVDTTLIENYRRIEGTQNNKPFTPATNTSKDPSNPGSKEVDLTNSGKDSASFQSYVFRLSPHVIVNDSTSFKAELTSGYGRGGRLGENNQKSQSGFAAGTLYSYNTTSDNSLNINKLYMELYADTATWVIGRHDFEFGMGAVYDAGNDVWDRHTFVRDGVTAKLKIGNFKFEPFYAKVSSDGSLTKSHRVREYGAALVYDNIDNDFTFGLLYNKKTNSPDAEPKDASNDVVNTDPTNNAFSTLGSTSVSVTDIYFKKGFNDLTMELEIPLTSGEIGNFFENGDIAKYKAKAFLFGSNYKLNETWSFGVDAGHVSGQDSSDSSFTAMYLNPNFQIAHLLFRYNLHAVTDSNQSIYDSYITNTMYAKLHGKFQTEKWEWDAAIIWAKALEVAQQGNGFFNHEQGHYVSTANANQADDLGIEFDMAFTYKWNNAVQVGGKAGYLLAGDYWGFTNDSSKNTAKDSYVLQLNTSLQF